MTIRETITIGRMNGSDYQVDSESVSNEHALLVVSDSGKYLLIDCGSTNGTRVPAQSGAVRISQLEVGLEDVVFFGDNERRIQDIVSSVERASFSRSEKDFTRIRDPIDGSIRRERR
jgi:pSer/pThr/pTyr-binding forkhead associated (FHA) protein